MSELSVTIVPGQTNLQWMELFYSSCIYNLPLVNHCLHLFIAKNAFVLSILFRWIPLPSRASVLIYFPSAGICNLNSCQQMLYNHSLFYSKVGIIRNKFLSKWTLLICQLRLITQKLNIKPKGALFSL